MSFLTKIFLSNFISNVDTFWDMLLIFSLFFFINISYSNFNTTSMRTIWEKCSVWKVSTFVSCPNSKTTQFFCTKYSRGKKYRHPYCISPIEIWLFWVKDQGCLITFKVCDLSSKWPYFKRAYVVRVWTFFLMAVLAFS